MGVRFGFHSFLIVYDCSLLPLFQFACIATTQYIIIDVLQAEDQANKFFFYEVYDDAAAIAFHKEQPHYDAWGAFKESGGTISSVSKKAAGKFMS